MEPKKKSKSFDVIISAMTFVLTVFVAFHGAHAFSSVRSSGIVGLNSFGEVLNRFESHISSRPFELSFNEYTVSCLGIFVFIWFVSVVYVLTTRKKLIIGKEHGTAEWGTLKDISELFASNILKAEKAKVLNKFPLAALFPKIPFMRILFSLVISAASGFGLYLIRPFLSKIPLIGLFDGWASVIFLFLIFTACAFTLIGFKQISNWKSNIRNVSTERKSAIKESFKKLNEKYKDADMLFTVSERASIYNIINNNNVLIIGGSGSGKTRGFVLPNILQAHSSFVVTDPKGEILEKSGKFLESRGYDIRVLNLDNMSKSDCYNSFVYIHPDSAYRMNPEKIREGYEDRVLALIETIILNTDGGEKRNSSDPFWEKAERLFLQALFFFVCDGFPPEEQNMNTVLWLIGLLKLEEDGDNFDSDLDYFVKIFSKNNNEYDAGGNLVREHIGVQQFREFREKASGKTAKSIVISAVARFAPFRTKEMVRIQSSDSMNLESLGEKKTAVFVVVPPTDSSRNFVAGMLFTQMFQELQYCATQKYKDQGQRLPVPVRFILDEFANTCKIPNFVKILAYARSFGVGIVPVLQSLEQIKEMYEKEWGVILDNCNYILYLGSVSHMDTLEYISKLLGKGTFDKRSTSRSYGKSGSSSKSWDTLGRELMMPDEIRMLPNDKCILIVSKTPPFYSDKYDYTKHPNYKMTSDGGAGSFIYDPQSRDRKILEIKAAQTADILDFSEPALSRSRPYRRPAKAPDANLIESRIRVTTDRSELLGSLRTNNFDISPPGSPGSPGGPSETSLLPTLFDDLSDRSGVDKAAFFAAVTDPLSLMAEVMPALMSGEVKAASAPSPSDSYVDDEIVPVDIDPEEKGDILNGFLDAAIQISAEYEKEDPVGGIAAA